MGSHYDNLEGGLDFICSLTGMKSEFNTMTDSPFSYDKSVIIRSNVISDPMINGFNYACNNNKNHVSKCMLSAWKHKLVEKWKEEDVLFWVSAECTKADINIIDKDSNMANICSLKLNGEDLLKCKSFKEFKSAIKSDNYFADRLYGSLQKILQYQKNSSNNCDNALEMNDGISLTDNIVKSIGLPQYDGLAEGETLTYCTIGSDYDVVNSNGRFTGNLLDSFNYPTLAQSVTESDSGVESDTSDVNIYDNLSSNNYSNINTISNNSNWDNLNSMNIYKFDKNNNYSDNNGDNDSNRWQTTWDHTSSSYSDNDLMNCHTLSDDNLETDDNSLMSTSDDNKDDIFKTLKMEDDDDNSLLLQQQHMTVLSDDNLSPKKPSKKGPGRPRGNKKKKPEKVGRIWEFLRDLLQNPKYCPSIICWDDYEIGTFRFVHSEKVAQLWGLKKENEGMTFEKFSRAMRYYYSRKILSAVQKRLVYQFGENATGWRTPNPILR